MKSQTAKMGERWWPVLVTSARVTAQYLGCCDTGIVATMAKLCANDPIRGWVAILGGVIVHFTLGTLYCFGILNPYVASYLRMKDRARGQHEAAFTETTARNTFIFAAAVFGQAAFMFIGGYINRAIGPRWTALLGGWIMSLGVFLAGFCTTLTGWVLSYGLLFGAGVGIAYAPPIGCGIAWLPTKTGLVSGCVVAGFGLGALVFDQVMTALINPHNVPAIKRHGEPAGYPDAVAERVPHAMTVIAIVYASLQLLGAMLIAPPPPNGAPGDDAERQAAGGGGGGGGGDDERTALLLPPGEADEEAAAADEHDEHPDEASGFGTLAPCEMMRQPFYWCLWCTFCVNASAVVFFSSLWKTFAIYGANVKNDDFLAAVGSVSSLFNAGGRLFWGAVADRKSYATAMTAMLVFMTALLATMPLSRTLATHGHSANAFIAVWTCCLFFCLAGNFSLFPAMIARSFGRKWFSVNYGLLFTSNVPAALIGAFGATKLKPGFVAGWAWEPVGATTAIGCLITLLCVRRLQRARAGAGKD